MPWPLHGLSLSTPDLVLRCMTEADALLLGSLKPDDLGPDPSAPSVGADVEQAYWRHLGQWRVEDWVLPFTVVAAGRPIGVQALEGKDFVVRRVVDSYSWLLPSARGQGLGKQMRAAVLELAFRGLGARWAVTEAYEDNAASLAVSRALGYQLNGRAVERREGREETVWMQHLLLDAAAWASPWPVTVNGLEPCLPLFGLA
ncbi:MAG TPA: GNAT family protein [Mycobacteriales bacterium]|nr:GNAT family protein [Mycobacteriales bacterium]